MIVAGQNVSDISSSPVEAVTLILKFVCYRDSLQHLFYNEIEIIVHRRENSIKMCH